MTKEFKYSLERESKRPTRVLCLAVGSPAEESCCCRTGGSAAEEGPPGRAEGWGQWGHQEKLRELGFPCLQEGRKAKEGGCWALPLSHGWSQTTPSQTLLRGAQQRQEAAVTICRKGNTSRTEGKNNLPSEGNQTQE